VLNETVYVRELKFMPTIARVPRQCRPNARLVFGVNSHATNWRVDVFPSGRVTYISGLHRYPFVSLDGIRYTVRSEEAFIPMSPHLTLLQCVTVSLLDRRLDPRLLANSRCGMLSVEDCDWDPGSILPDLHRRCQPSLASVRFAFCPAVPRPPTPEVSGPRPILDAARLHAWSSRLACTSNLHPSRVDASAL